MAAYLFIEGGAVTAACQPKMLGDGFTDVGERRSRPDVAAKAWSGADHRNAFARMIGAVPGRIVAMVGGEDEKVACLSRASASGSRRSKASSAAA